MRALSLGAGVCPYGDPTTCPIPRGRYRGLQCPDCGAYGVGPGHMECPYPRDHEGDM